MYGKTTICCSDFCSYPDAVRNEGLYVENIHKPFENNNLRIYNFDGEAITHKLIEHADKTYHQFNKLFLKLNAMNNFNIC